MNASFEPLEARAYAALRALSHIGREALEEGDEVQLPLNLGLNDGTYMPEACVRVLAQHCHRAALRNYPTAGNDALRRAIARTDGVTPDHILLHHGSGPLLKQVLPSVIEAGIRRNPLRIAKHLLSRSGFPVITPLFTYGKVPGKAAERKLAVRAMPVGPDNGFRVTPAMIEAELKRAPGIVYIVNPNNPTGNVMIDRLELEPLIAAWPDAIFWVDEAYVQYCEDDHQRFAPLVMRYPNLMVSRTFSFAYGLAGIKVGYLLGQPDLVRSENSKLTDYRIGKLAEDLCVAALNDEEHLPWLREVCATQRALLRAGLERHGIEVFPSVTNFVLCRFHDGRTGAALKAKLAERHIQIKVLSPFAGADFAPYFRITLGLANENRKLLRVIDEIMAAGDI